MKYCAIGLCLVFVNNFSATASSNWGNSTLCIATLTTFFNIGEVASTNLCKGTLFDSGGDEGAYDNFENHSFTICPTEVHGCIAIEVENYDIEAEFDRLTIFEGPTTTGQQLLTIDRIGQFSLAYAKSECITVQFTSDASQTRSGFKLNWECLVEECPEVIPTTCDAPAPIGQIPFVATNLSTCFAGNNIEIGPCGGDDFLNGLEYIFAYDSPGDECVAITLEGINPETGISILRGCPESGDAVCINQKQGVENQSTLFLPNVSLEEKGTYYFLIANEHNCTPFNISIDTSTTCPVVFPSASDCENALVLNGCDPNLPTALTVELGSGDSDFFKFGINNGCWEDVFETNYTWFTFEAQADGEFAFLLSNNDPDELVDIDFNIWGPFDNLENTCVNSENSQPIRSSWADNLLYSLTGLANINPELGTPVTSVCEGAFGEGFLKPLQVKKGEVYAVLINDFDGVIFSGAIAIDFAGTTPGVLTNIPNSIQVSQDTFICGKETITLNANGASAYEWSPNESLSCRSCPTPIASPTETTTYTLNASNVCSTIATEVTIEVINANAGADQSICQGAIIALNSEINVSDVSYNWSSLTGIANLSCTNCPNPILTANDAGDFEYILDLQKGSCLVSDTMRLTIEEGATPIYHIANNQQLCLGDSIHLGGTSIAGQMYEWFTNSDDFTATIANPIVQPSARTTYFLRVSNIDCSIPILDSVTITVDSLPANLVISPADTTICLGTQLILSSPIYDSLLYPIIQHQWLPNIGFDSSDSLYNLVLTPTNTVLLNRINQNGICLDTSTAIINVQPFVEIDITPTVNPVCEGETIDLLIDLPEGATNLAWSPTENISCSDCPTPSVSPIQTTTYILSGTWMNCSIMGLTEIAVTDFSNTTLVNLDTNIIFIGESVDSIVLQTDLENIIDIEWREDGQVIIGANDLILSYIPLANAPVSEEVRTVTIEATITTSDGCIFFLETSITVLPPTVPNVFTPGNDGLNDYFTIALSEKTDNITIFKVYNRWGTLIYDNEVPEKGWDGSRRNNQEDLMPSGVYIYIIEYQVGEQIRTVKGNVTLIR